MKDADTKSKILEAAEQLYATKGFAATSLRTIIKEAGVNTAAVHYHFGSREGLIEAVFARRAGPINEERLKSLRALEERHGSDSIPPESLIEAFVGPAIRRHFDRGLDESLIPQLMSRAVTEADPAIHRIFVNIFGEVFMRFTAAFMKALPHLSPADVNWRIHLMVGAMAFTMAVPRLHSRLRDAAGHPANKDILGDPEDSELALRRLVGFVAAGMRATVPAETSGGTT